MNILRGLSRGLLSLLIALMMTLWVITCVLLATLLNRDTTMGWLRDSGIYSKALPAVVQLQDQNGEAASDSFVTLDDVKAALNTTFPPAYIQQQAENVLHAAYDWIEGKEQDIRISIPIQLKQKDFTDNIAKEVEKKLAALPPCPTRVNPNPEKPTCIPQGMSAADLATRLTPEMSTEGGKFLDRPITEKELGLSDTSTVDWIPPIRSNLNWMAVGLPIAIVVLAAGYVLLSDPKLKGFGIISRRILLNGVFLTIGGLILWYIGNTADVSQWVPASSIAELINPFFRQLLPALGRTLAAIGGGVALVGGACWIAAIIIRRRGPKLTINPDPQPIHDLPKPPRPDHPSPPSSDKPPKKSV